MVGLLEIADIRERVTAASRALAPGALALNDAQRMLADVTVLKNAAATMEALLARRIADTGEWRRAGDRSAEEHLARTMGTSVGRARDALETASRPTALEATNEAARSGSLSPEQAAAVSDAAAADPTAEANLLGAAVRGSLKDLRDECAKVKAAADPDPEETYRRNRADRSLRIWADRNGVDKLFGATTPDQMATIKAAVEKRADELFAAARAEGRREPRGAYMIDVLEQICAEWLGAPPVPVPAPAPRARHGRSKTPPFLGIVRVDLEVLRRGAVVGEETCEIAGLGPVPVSVARRLVGESVLYLVLSNGSAVGTTVNLKRGPNTAQRVALLATQPDCGITGCASPFTEIDHVDPWASCHVTELANLRRWCTHHHDLKSQGWAVIHEDGIVFMVPPDDDRHPGRRRAPPDGGRV